MKPTLSILIPAYNVENTIEFVVTHAYAVGRKVASKLEILVVNDASIDNTGVILKNLRKRFPPLRIITHKQNEGYGKTIKELYTSGKYDWLFSFPGDDQFEATELLKLLPAAAHADMILGWRNNRHDPTLRLLQSKIYNGLLNVFFSLKLHDVNTIRLMKRSLIKSIFLQSNTAFVDAELAIKTKRKGFHIAEVAIAHKYRHAKGATGGKFFKTIYPTIIDMIREFNKKDITIT